MKKKLTLVGNSHCMILNKALLDILQIDPDNTEISITTDGDSIILTPQRKLKTSLLKKTRYKLFIESRSKNGVYKECKR